MRKIIIVGYPKSGNTWLSRLTASLVDCPVEGFLYSNDKEFASEGEYRKSKFRVYKSHHQLFELAKEDITSAEIIYVIRDPRDVSISGRHYFHFGKPIFSNINWTKHGPFFKFSNILKVKTNNLKVKIIRKLFSKSEMNKAVLYGNKNVHHWCRVSWKTHIMQYINNPNILKVQYELLLSDPLTECKRILDFLGVEKDEEEISQCIAHQSFANKKKKYLKENEQSKANFLRKGIKEQWKSVFSEKENLLFVDSLKEELVALGYDLELGR